MGYYGYPQPSSGKNSKMSVMLLCRGRLVIVHWNLYHNFENICKKVFAELRNETTKGTIIPCMRDVIWHKGWFPICNLFGGHLNNTYPYYNFENICKTMFNELRNKTYKGSIIPSMHDVKMA